MIFRAKPFESFSASDFRLSMRKLSRLCRNLIGLDTHCGRVQEELSNGNEAKKETNSRRAG